jgi:two-component system OmpR family sensor kinase
MTGLVDDLLLLARLDQVEALDIGHVDLALLLHDAASDAAAVDPEREVVLDVPEPLVIEADEDRLRQVVGALVTNAMIHTPSSAGLSLRSTPTSGPGGTAGSGVVIEIADGGPGMAPDVASHAFERFYRGDLSRTRHRGGSGLGLAIVDSIVTAHGGTVELESSVAAGTRVRIVLAS